MPCTQILVHSWNSEQGYWRCFTELTRTLVLSVVLANSPALLKKKTFFDIVILCDVLITVLDGKIQIYR